MAATSTTGVTKPAPPRTETQLTGDLARAKRRVSENIDSLVAELHPQALTYHVKEEAKEFAQEQFQEAKQRVKDQYGWRVDRFVMAGGAVLGVVAFVLVVRALSDRAKRS